MFSGLIIQEDDDDDIIYNFLTLSSEPEFALNGVARAVAIVNDATIEEFDGAEVTKLADSKRAVKNRG